MNENNNPKLYEYARVLSLCVKVQHESVRKFTCGPS